MYTCTTGTTHVKLKVRDCKIKDYITQFKYLLGQCLIEVMYEYENLTCELQGVDRTLIIPNFTPLNIRNQNKIGNRNQP